MNSSSSRADDTPTITTTTRRKVYFPIMTLNTTIHEYFMRLALQQANIAFQLEEVPIGALVVRNLTTPFHISSISSTTNTTTTTTLQLPPSCFVFEILSAQHNRVEQRYDASAHAELLALQDAGKAIQNWRLSAPTTTTVTNKNQNNQNLQQQQRHHSVVLYTTLEPCTMCLASAIAFRITELVYGAPDIRLGAVHSYIQLLQHCTPTSTTTGVTTGTTMTQPQQLPKHPYHNITKVTSGVLEQECGAIVRSFFRNQRRRKKK